MASGTVCSSWAPDFAAVTVMVSSLRSDSAGFTGSDVSVCAMADPVARDMASTSETAEVLRKRSIYSSLKAFYNWKFQTFAYSQDLKIPRWISKFLSEALLKCIGRRRLGQSSAPGWPPDRHKRSEPVRKLCKCCTDRTNRTVRAR